MTQSQPLKVETIKPGMVTPPRAAPVSVPAQISTTQLAQWKTQLNRVLAGETNNNCLSDYALKVFVSLIDEVLPLRAAQEAKALQEHLEQKNESAA